MDVNMKMPDLATNEGVELGITRWLVTRVNRSSAARRCSKSKPTKPSRKSNASPTAC